MGVGISTGGRGSELVSPDGAAGRTQVLLLIMSYILGVLASFSHFSTFMGPPVQSLRTPTLRVVPSLTAIADRAASRLPKSRLTILSIRHSGSLVRAGARVFGNITPATKIRTNLTADSVQQQPIAAPEGSEINHGIHRDARKREPESTSPFRVLPGGNSRP